MTTSKPIAQTTSKEKAKLKAIMLAMGMDDSDVFPGVLGNRNNVTLTKPLRRRKLALRKKAKVTA